MNDGKPVVSFPLQNLSIFCGHHYFNTDMFPAIKNYTLVREIGAGGMAVVYEAMDDRLQRTVAIKVLHPHLCRDPAASDRFIREARAAAKIDHPNVVRIFDFGSVDDLHYIIMEFVPGNTMERVLKEQGTVSPDNAIAIMGEIAEGLAQAHALGIIHRDVKPANILLHRQGRAMLSDFGLAHHLPDPRLTSDDTVAGTPSFMSPEQMSGKIISAATDIYSWGVCLYTLVAGKLPYSTESYPEVLNEIRRGEIRLDEAVMNRLPSWYHDILHRCFVVDPQKRIGDANELLKQLSPQGKKRPAGIDVAALQSGSFAACGGEPASSPSATVVLPLNNGFRMRRVVIIASLLTAGVGGALLIISQSGRRITADRLQVRNETSVVHEIIRSDSIERGSGAADTISQVMTQVNRRSSDDGAGRSPDRPESVDGNGGARTSRPSPAEVSRGRQPRAADSTVQATDSIAAAKAPDSGSLFIHCNPWAIVRVGDSEIGTTPFEKPFTLPAGRHIITLTNSFCEPLADTVDVSAGTIVRKRYTLKARPQ